LEVQKRPGSNVSNGEHPNLPTLQIQNWPVTTGKVGVAGIEAINAIANRKQRHPYSANPHFFPGARRLNALERHRITRGLVTMFLDEPPQFLRGRGGPGKAAIQTCHHLARESGATQCKRKCLPTRRVEHGWQHWWPVLREYFSPNNPVAVTVDALAQLSHVAITAVSLNKLTQFRRGEVTPNKTAVQTRQRPTCGEFGASILCNRKGTQPCGPEYWRLVGGAKAARDELLTAALGAPAHAERGGVWTKWRIGFVLQGQHAD
jgi:hypothetical protein